MKFKIIIICIATLYISHFLQAQNPVDSFATTSKIELYANLYHQHHNFFDKAFSYQGFELGLIYKQQLMLGLYGSCFASNLKANINNQIQFIWIGQCGAHIGYIYHSRKRIYPGIQLNTGVFFLHSNNVNYQLFQSKQLEFKFSGLVMSPNIFGELHITDWLKIRMGFSYNLYFYKDHAMVKTSDLNHISFTFGMIFSFK